ncbi:MULTISPECIES: methyl-accepting chemotaxis protein [Clostridium]|jgi:methyl-accepting chemotaxis protein|uniref:methyl-accepting chemotaxis protein n=1 Tax=Clostridium TaxID=1485 RepID=UPI000983D255|nr:MULTISPECIES: methyl-accepting chemotaxis protein [Clostridium]AQR95281.1 methyl-accepting chemotaxis protein 4 [Clostridium saccharoperbutylacetonicum]NSB31136.1 methyl-accepting chemotaxis protein [Clostridium saccharoperbutylacetonicum]
MFNFLGKDNNTDKIDSNINAAELNKVEEKEFGYTNEIFDLANQIQRNIDVLVNEEGSITYGLDSILKGSEVTTEQTDHVNEHLKTLSENSDNTKRLVDGVFLSLDKSKEEINMAKKDFNEIINQVQSISSVFDEFNEVISEIQTNYNSIQGLASIITGIAGQTNLLSLNASIEAARVGEVGKGFSVVANEIKKLSLDTQDNAKDIMTSLKNLTQSMERLMSKSNDGVNVINKTSGVIGASSTILDRIAKAEAEVHKDLQEVQVSQINNLEGIKEISTNLVKLVDKSKSENQELEEIIFSIQKKADCYTNILNYLNQIKILKDQSNN